MTNKLKPCPFCGDQPKLTDCIYDALTIIECESCKKTRDRTVCVEHALHDQAIKSWNTRAERTCKILGDWKSVSNTQEIKPNICSSCGYDFGLSRRDHVPFEIESLQDIPNYCPHCGAKVAE